MTPSPQIKNDPDRCQIRRVDLHRIARARSAAIPDDEMERLARTYGVLGNPTRLKILMALKDGEMCVCDLAAYIGISESGVSHQLRRLKDLALVKKRRAGQILYYVLDDTHVFDLLAIGLEHVRE